MGVCGCLRVSVGACMCGAGVPLPIRKQRFEQLNERQLVASQQLVAAHGSALNEAMRPCAGMLWFGSGLALVWHWFGIGLSAVYERRLYTLAALLWSIHYYAV